MEVRRHLFDSCISDIPPTIAADYRAFKQALIQIAKETAGHLILRFYESDKQMTRTYGGHSHCCGKNLRLHYCF